MSAHTASDIPSSMEHIYEVALSNTPDFVYIFDLDHRFIYANKALLEMWGKTREEALGKQLLELGYEAWHADMHDRELEMVKATKKPIKGEVPFTGTNGRRIYEYIFSPVIADNGEVTVIAGTTRDVTERRQAAEALRHSEERIKLALNASEFVGTWNWDIKHNRVYADERFARLYQVDPQLAAIGAPISEYTKAIHPDDMARIAPIIEKATAEGSNFAEEYRLIQADGSIRWVVARGRSHLDEHGEATHFDGAAIDITERKNAETAEAEAREHLSLMVESARDYAIISMDLKGIIISWSNGAQRIFGYEPQDVLGKRIDIIFTPEDRQHGRPQYELDTAAANGKASDERWHLRQNGERFYVSGIMAAMHDEHGNIKGFVKIARDMTKEQKAQEALLEARNAAEAANIAKTEFLANMSHEIRTPMNAVIGLTHILSMSQPLTAKQREFIQTLKMSADALLSLINDLLDIAKIEARTVELERIPFSVTAIVMEVVSMMVVRSREKGLIFTSDGECLQARMFMGDPTRLRQIIMNLCSNAIKFTEQGGVHIYITCRKTDNPSVENVCIAVKDTGIGIAEEKLDSIFHKFVQADASINRKYGGTGLGLAITKTLTEIMGGSISVTSVLGEGSVFEVCVPLEIANDMQSNASDESLPTIIDSLVNIDNKHRILLVEDYPANVLVATTFLGQFGYIVDVANTGIEAFELIKMHKYDLALMDVQMHGMNGFETTQLIRQHEKTHNLRHLPIIGMTAHALAGDRERCIASGMDDYVPKPFNPEELQEKIKFFVTSNVLGCPAVV